MDLLRKPIEGGAKSGKKKAAKRQLLEEWGQRHSKPEEEPGRTRQAEKAINGRIGRARQKQPVEHSEQETNQSGTEKIPAALQCSLALPLKSGKESLVPKQRKYDQAAAESEDVEDAFGAEGVVELRGRFGDGGDAEEMIGNGGAG